MAECGECHATARISSEVRHHRSCPWQSVEERASELERAIKVHRAATLDRLSKIDANRARMLAPDKALYAVLDRG